MSNIEVNLFINGHKRSCVFDENGESDNDSRQLAVNEFKIGENRIVNDNDGLSCDTTIDDNEVLIKIIWNSDMLRWEASSNDLIGIHHYSDDFDVLINRIQKTIISDYNLRPGTKLVINATKTIEI